MYELLLCILVCIVRRMKEDNKKQRILVHSAANIVHIKRAATQPGRGRGANSNGYKFIEQRVASRSLPLVDYYIYRIVPMHYPKTSTPLLMMTMAIFD